MEDHERQQQVVVQSAEDGQHHGGAYGQAFLGAAEDDGNAVFPIETEQTAEPIGAELSQHEQQQTGNDQPPQVQGVELLPVACHGGSGEGGIDHEPDGALVIPADEFLSVAHEALQPALAHLPQHEWQENLIADFENRVSADFYVGGACGKEEPDQKRGQEYPQQAGDGGRADGGGYIAPCHGGEGDAALHGGGQAGYIHQPHEQRRPGEWLQQRSQQRGHYREKDEGEEKHQSLQPPVEDTLYHGFAR